MAVGVDAGVAAVDSGPLPIDAGATQGAVDASVLIDFSGDAGQVPLLFRLGVQVNHAADVVNRAVAIEHRLGHLRLNLGYAVMSPATSPADAVARVNQSNVRAQVEAARALGAEVTLNLVETPRYLSSCPSETQTEPISGWPMYSTCPPADLAAWEALVRAIVTAVGPGPHWELWNEPDGIFWRGTQEQFFALYVATARAVRQADSTASIGGPTVSSPWAGTAPASSAPGVIQNFLAYCASHPIPELGLARTPVDFVVWHEYGLIGAGSFKATNDVRRWAVAAGYPNAQLNVDEWNVQTEGSPPGGLSDIFHTDSEFGAAYVVSSLLARHRAGLDRHAFSALADWSRDPPEFHGGQGLTTASGLRKPAWNAMRLVGKLNGRLVPVTVSSEALLVEGVASISNDSLWVLVVNSVPDWRFGLEHFAAIEHFDDAALLAEIAALPGPIKEALLVTFTVTGAGLPVSPAARVLADLLAARSRLLMAARQPVTITVAMKGIPSGFTRVRSYVIDSKTSNSYRAWVAAGGSASPASIPMAFAAMDLKMTSTRSRTEGPTEAITVALEPDAIVAYELLAP